MGQEPRNIFSSQQESMDEINNQALSEPQQMVPEDLQYYVITKPWEVQQLATAIMEATQPKDGQTPILGIDCEGLAKNRSMQLIQVYFANRSFLIDLKAVNPFLHGLKEVMES